MKLFPLALAALVALPAPALADDAPPAAPDKVRSVTVFGNDACPPSTANEIVVCARRPESDRYRIPKALRHKKPRDADGAWSNTVSMLDQVSRDQMTPNSCSPNGANGQTGCNLKFQHQWYLDHQQQKADARSEAAAAAAAEAELPPQP